jgi:putative FmdB family regulatory protein
MPLYDFLCRACGQAFEAQSPVDQLPACPRCGAAEAERQLSSFAGPFRVGLRGAAAKRSNAQREAREERRREQRATSRERADQG